MQPDNICHPLDYSEKEKVSYSIEIIIAAFQEIVFYVYGD